MFVTQFDKKVEQVLLMFWWPWPISKVKGGFENNASNTIFDLNSAKHLLYLFTVSVCLQVWEILKCFSSCPQLMSYEQAGNLSNMSDYLPSAVKQAAGRAGVEPISSSDNLVAEAMDAQELQGMLEAELTRSLSDRLEHDDDYSAERWEMCAVLLCARVCALTVI